MDAALNDTRDETDLFPAPDDGARMYRFAGELFPICRSLTGEGVRRTLRLIQGRLGPSVPLKIVEIPSGTKCFDWEIPEEWNISDAYILDPSGAKIVDFTRNNLHVVGYSIPVDREMTLEELDPHLHSLPEQPDAIPYVTSYYRRAWGFCLTHRQRAALRPGRYRVRIQSVLAPGSLTYGEILLPGESGSEVLLSTNVCHPSMANNEVSGLVVATFLARRLAALASRRHAYRVLFLPETIGAIAYLSANLAALKRGVAAGFQITCVGDDGAYTFLPSRLGDTLADKAARHALRHAGVRCRTASFLERGSDERQYCSPNVDLPVVSLMRSKYHDYPQYHTSLDDMSFISPAGLLGAFSLHAKCLRLLEANRIWRLRTLGEPQLGRRGLYPMLSKKGGYPDEIPLMMDLMAYCDGRHDLIDVADRLGVDAETLAPVAARLAAAGLLEADAHG